MGLYMQKKLYQTNGLIKSPCINVCVLEDKLCLGCGRTLEQISSWSKYTEAERQQIIEGLNAKRGE